MILIDELDNNIINDYTSTNMYGKPLEKVNSRRRRRRHFI